MDDIREAAAQAKGGSMHPRTTWGKVFDHPLYKKHFEQPAHSNLPYYEVVTRDNAVQRFLTWSGIAVMDPEAKQKAIDTVVDIISEAQDKGAASPSSGGKVPATAKEDNSASNKATEEKPEVLTIPSADNKL